MSKIVEFVPIGRFDRNNLKPNDPSMEIQGEILKLLKLY